MTCFDDLNVNISFILFVEHKKFYNLYASSSAEPRQPARLISLETSK